jgi:putative effector of murein hydrolase LrgA (UPF0299 family)
MDWKTIFKISLPSGIAGFFLYGLLATTIFRSDNLGLEMIGNMVNSMLISIIIVGIVVGVLTYNKVKKSKFLNAFISILIAILVTISPILFGTLFFG